MVDGNRIEGAWDKAKGAIKEGIGELTGNEKLKDEGMADKAKGTAESAVGGAKDTVRDVASKVLVLIGGQSWNSPALDGLGVCGDRPCLEPLGRLAENTCWT